MNKLIAVTGGTKGIGRAIVEIFGREKFDIITCSRTLADLNVLEQEYKVICLDTTIKTVVADVSTKDGISKFLNAINEEPRAVDVLVNNVGCFIPGGISTEDEETLDQTMRTNLYSAYHITRGVLGPMRDRSKGHIFNMCSTASTMAYPNGASYCMSKFALLGFSKVLREETKSEGLRVTAVLPGPTYTSSWEGANIPEDRFLKAEDVGQAVFDTWQLSGNAVVEELVIRPGKGDLD